MIISIITLFPDMFSSVFSSSIIKRALAKKQITIHYINIRDFATDAYKSVDNHPYGGGTGMILRVDVLDRAIQFAKKQVKNKKAHIVLMDPQGTPYTQATAQSLTKQEHLILICGHYEGVDERVRELVTEEISIGDYVLTGGEIPAMVIVDSITRLLPGVLPKEDATIHESFSEGTLEYPQYTRPEVYKKQSVPSVLLSGNHKVIDEWRRDQAQKKTYARRPDLVTEKTG
jgi:tRNA (guanine37-N1)-methyltransferase